MDTNKEGAARTVDVSDLIRKSQAAELSGITRAAMQDRIEAHPRELEVVDIGGVPFLKRSQVLAFNARRRGAGKEEAAAA